MDSGLHWCFPMRKLNCKIFGLHPKVMLPQPTYASIFVAITLVGPTKVSIMKLKCTVLNKMWQHDFMMKQIFFSSIFLSENTGWLAKQAGYAGHDPWHTRYNLKFCAKFDLCLTTFSQDMKSKEERCLNILFQSKIDKS